MKHRKMGCSGVKKQNAKQTVGMRVDCLFSGSLCHENVTITSELHQMSLGSSVIQKLALEAF